MFVTYQCDYSSLPEDRLHLNTAKDSCNLEVYMDEGRESNTRMHSSD